MKILTFIITALLLTLPLAAQAQLDFGFGIGPLGTDRIGDVRIGIMARDKLQSHLKAEYRQLCESKKKKPAVCAETTALYNGRAFPQGAGQPLTPQEEALAGFVPPGTTYVRQGFVIYLISWPRKIIMDSVAPENSWKLIK